MPGNKPFYRTICIKVLKTIFKICFQAIDMCAAILVGLFLPFPLLITKYFINTKKEFQGERNILFLSGASTLEDCYRKFGNFEPLFNYDGPIKSFNRVILFWFLVRNNLTVSLRDDFIINERKGIKFFHLTSHLLVFIELLFLVKRKNIKVVRAFDPYQKGLMGWAISYLNGIPSCVSVHADYEKREALQGKVIPRIFGSKKISLSVVKFVYRNVNLVLPIRESLGSKIKANGGATVKIKIFPHGIDLTPFSVHNSLQWLEGKEKFYQKIIISAAIRLEKENYIADVISIAQILSRKRDDFVILIAGDGSQKENMRAEIDARGLGSQVLLLGFITRKQVISLKQNSYLSLCLMGGFSLIEACAAGRPVISYDVEWHSELVRNYETGFLISEGDIDEVVGKIEFLLDNPKIAKKMGENAKALAFQRHSFEVTTRIKDEIYESLLDMNK